MSEKEKSNKCSGGGGGKPIAENLEKMVVLGVNSGGFNRRRNRIY